MEDQNFSELTIKCQQNFQNGTKEDKPNSSNINSEDIDKETIDKLRGDAIGDTMYSQSSVIKILLQLSDLNWNKDLEDDLCYLWDMTVERDVCEYLYQLSFPSIATAIILKHNEPRLIEIIIGILGNICSNNEVDHDITDVEISIVLNAMDTDDHLILIQIMRFVIAIVHHRNHKLEFITPDILEKICFILRNSTNIELLSYAMETVSKITVDFKLDRELVNVNVLESVLVGFRFLTSNKSDKSGFDDEDMGDNLKYVSLFVQIVLNLGLYVNERLNSDVRRDFLRKSPDISEECRKIIKESTEEIITPSTTFYFESFTIIFPIFNVKYDREIFVNLLETISMLTKSNEIQINPFIELVRYFVSKGDVNDIVVDSRRVKCDVKEVLKFVADYKSECEFDFKENLYRVMEEIG